MQLKVLIFPICDIENDDYSPVQATVQLYLFCLFYLVEKMVCVFGRNFSNIFVGRPTVEKQHSHRWCRGDIIS